MDSVRPALGAQPVVAVASTALDLRRRGSSFDGFWLADNDESEPLGIDQFARKLCNIISRHRLDIALARVFQRWDGQLGKLILPSERRTRRARRHSFVV